MAIVVTCACGRKLQVQDEFAGQEGQCPGCDRTFLIPESNGAMEMAPTSGNEIGAVPSPDAEPTRRSAPMPPAPQVQSSEPIHNHGGDPLPPDADFFADPPANIGPVVSAYTTLRRGVEPWSPVGRMALALALGLLGGLLGHFVIRAIHPRNHLWMMLVPLMGTGSFIVIAIASTGFKHTCTFVGRAGLARIRCQGVRDNVDNVETFPFRDAAELRTGLTHRYVNGVYQGTDYRFGWTDGEGRPRFLIAGTHKSEKANPRSTDPFHFGRASEIAWTLHLLDATIARVEQNNDVLFTLKGNQWVRLGRGYMVLCSGGEEQRWNADEIGMVNVDKGVVRIRRRDAKEGWLSSPGVFKFNLDSLANAQLFFHLCSKVVGVPVR